MRGKTFIKSSPQLLLVLRKVQKVVGIFFFFFFSFFLHVAIRFIYIIYNIDICVWSKNYALLINLLIQIVWVLLFIDIFLGIFIYYSSMSVKCNCNIITLTGPCRF